MLCVGKKTATREGSNSFYRHLNDTASLVRMKVVQIISRPIKPNLILPNQLPQLGPFSLTLPPNSLSLIISWVISHVRTKSLCPPWHQRASWFCFWASLVAFYASGGQRRGQCPDGKCCWGPRPKLGKTSWLSFCKMGLDHRQLNKYRLLIIIDYLS